MKLKELTEIPPWEWPPGTGTMLQRILLDERAPETDLRQAAELAGDVAVIDDELADALLSTVRSGGRSEHVRSRAAISLGPVLELADEELADEGEFDDASAVPISERTFRRIRETLHELYADAGVPKEVRRRVLEASVRAPRDWHPGAIRAAYASGDEAWKQSALFCMGYVAGFDEEILEALGSGDERIHYQAVIAAGNQELEAAWPHVAGLVSSPRTEKALLLAAIEAAAAISPQEAPELLEGLLDSEDEDVAAAVEEALAMAEAFVADDEDGEDGEAKR